MRECVFPYSEIDVFLQQQNYPSFLFDQTLFDLVMGMDVFPILFYNQLYDQAMRGDGTELVQLLIAKCLTFNQCVSLFEQTDQFPFLLLITAKCDKDNTGDLVLDIRDDQNLRDLIKRLSDRHETYIEWQKFRKEDTPGKQKVENDLQEYYTDISAKLISIQGPDDLLTLDPEIARWQKIIDDDLHDSRDVSSAFLGLKKVFADSRTKKPRNETDDEVVSLRRPSTVRQYSIGDVSATIREEVLGKSKSSTKSSQKEDKSCVLDDDKLNEVNLNKMKDPLSVFMRLACGVTGLKFIDLFADIPANSPTYTNPRLIDAYVTCLHPVALAGYIEMFQWLSRLSENPLIMVSLLRPEMVFTPLFTAAARLCGIWMRDGFIKNPIRSIQSRYSSADHKQDLNNAIRDVIDLL